MPSSGQSNPSPIRDRSIRGLIHAYRIYFMGLALIILAASMYRCSSLTQSPFQESAPVAATWIYNLKTQQVVPPGARESTNLADANLVIAYVYSCGDCADESTHFIGYLEKNGLTPIQGSPPPLPITTQAAPSTEAADTQASSLENPATGPGAGLAKPPVMMKPARFVALPPQEASGEVPDDLPQWVETTSPNAASIRDNFQSKCGTGRTPTACAPGLKNVPPNKQVPAEAADTPQPSPPPAATPQ